LAEEGWIEGEVPEKVAETYLAPLRESGVDTVILGCTHYPVLRDVIARTLGEKIRLVDTAASTVRSVADRLGELKLLREGAGQGSRRFFLSDVPVRFREIGGRFLGEAIEDLTWIEQSEIPWYER
jgi:glutamate racemase